MEHVGEGKVQDKYCKIIKKTKVVVLHCGFLNIELYKGLIYAMLALALLYKFGVKWRQRLNGSFRAHMLGHFSHPLPTDY